MESSIPLPPPVPGVEHEHVPVLYDEVLAELDPQPGGRYLDGTLGMGGHAWGILYSSSPTGRLLAMDQDPTAIEIASQRLQSFAGRWIAVRANFEKMKEVAEVEKFVPLDGILLDLGFSSMQMEDEQRGFSFQADAPLDMRLDPEGLTTAADLVNTLGEKELADLIYRYGEERQSRRIARAIVQNRPFVSARVLGETIARAVKRRGRERIHPATRTFQALRIAVNDELGVLERVLPDAVSLLKAGGRLAIISFHSLEDRIVKNFFRDEATDCLCPPELLFCACGHKATLDRESATRKPITPSPEEIERNPRARSAKLRVAERLDSTTDERRSTTE
ncbi:MAG: 16S rRNA (cytosine(1402)-N(4))-methyltransferase RsmH [Chloroflexota bacterium]|nr:16S rRNA (cytosine(1402)-N(4))-methyltransferase RsmH [Chloroflexota bacterium]